MYETRNSISLKYDSVSKSSYSGLHTVRSMDGLYPASCRPPRTQDYMRLRFVNDSYPPAPTSFANKSVASRRGSGARHGAPSQAFADSSNPVIGRPQQMVDGGVVYRNSRPSIFSLATTHPIENGNAPIKELKPDSNGGVAKSTSSASDSSVTSYGSASTSSVSTTTNTSGESNAATVPPEGVKLRMRHSLGKEEVEKDTTYLAVEATNVRKRLTR